MRFKELDVSKLTMFLNNYKPLVTALLSLLKQAELKFAQADERLKARSLICEVDVLKNFLVHEPLQQLEREISQWLRDRLNDSKSIISVFMEYDEEKSSHSIGSEADCQCYGCFFLG